ncbi:MAG: PIN domain-containing protein [Thermoplasmatota archaeon]
MVENEGGGIFSPDEMDDNCIILDANSLLAPFQNSFNLDSELVRVLPNVSPVVPTSVLRELERLKGKGDWRIKAALDLSAKYPKVDIKGKGDAPIFNLAVKKGWPVMTQDKRLRLKLLGRGIPVVVIKDRGQLFLMEP